MYIAIFHNFITPKNHLKVINIILNSYWFVAIVPVLPAKIIIRHHGRWQPGRPPDLGRRRPEVRPRLRAARGAVHRGAGCRGDLLQACWRVEGGGNGVLWEKYMEHTVDGCEILHQLIDGLSHYL